MWGQTRMTSPSLPARRCTTRTDGQVLGQVSGYTTDGFEVKIGEGGSASGDDAETIPGQEFGEGYLMWRCSECGEMGDLGSGMPDTCPECGAPEESIYAVEED